MLNTADTISTINASHLIAVGSPDTGEMVRSHERWLPATHVASTRIVSVDDILVQRINKRFCFTPRQMIHYAPRKRLFCIVFAPSHKADVKS